MCLFNNLYYGYMNNNFLIRYIKCFINSIYLGKNDGYMCSILI